MSHNKMPQTPIQRLELYLRERRIVYASVEKKVDMTPGYLSRQIANNTSIGANMLASICEALPDLNPAWLLTGKGAQELTNESFGDDGSIGLDVTSGEDKILAMATDHFKMIGGMEISVAEKLKYYEQFIHKLLFYIKDQNLDNKLLKDTVKHLTKEQNVKM